MDTCTLSTITTMTLQACFMPSQCDRIGDVNICIGGMPIACPQPAQVYGCIRPNGTRYEMSQEEVERLRRAEPPAQPDPAKGEWG